MTRSLPIVGIALRLACVASVVAGVTPVLAQAIPAYPVKPVSLVVPFPPGGATDAAARLVAGELTQALGQNVVVENLAGASGSIAAQKVVRAAPDGYTLLMGTINDVVLAPAVNPSVTYTYRQLTPIGLVGVTSFVLVSTPTLPAKPEPRDAFARYVADEDAKYRQTAAGLVGTQ